MFELWLEASGFLNIEKILTEKGQYKSVSMSVLILGYQNATCRICSIDIAVCSSNISYPVLPSLNLKKNNMFRQKTVLLILR